MKTRVAMNFRCRKKWEGVSEPERAPPVINQEILSVEQARHKLQYVRYIGVLYVGTRVIVEKYDSKK